VYPQRYKTTAVQLTTMQFTNYHLQRLYQTSSSEIEKILPLTASGYKNNVAADRDRSVASCQNFHQRRLLAAITLCKSNPISGTCALRPCLYANHWAAVYRQSDPRRRRSSKSYYPRRYTALNPMTELSLC
jgi:hypothetical protein